MCFHLEHVLKQQGLVFFFSASRGGPTQTWSETEETYDSLRRDLPLIGNVLQAWSFCFVRFVSSLKMG